MTKFKQLLILALISLLGACLFAGEEPTKKDASKKDAPKAQTKAKQKVPVAGMVAQIDQDGNLVADPKLSPEVQEALADMINTSSEGLVEQRLEDGTVIVDLQGRFQSAVVAHIGADGKLHTSCVSNVPGHKHEAEPDKPGTRGGKDKTPAKSTDKDKK